MKSEFFNRHVTIGTSGGRTTGSISGIFSPKMTEISRDKRTDKAEIICNIIAYYYE